MKKKIFTRFYMLAMLILFATSPLQAQNWLLGPSMMMYTNLTTDVYTQKVKPYDDRYLIAISKYQDSVKYCFSLWENNNNLVYNSFIDTTGITINDFTVLGDSIYFCGNIETAPNTWHGILGRFDVNDFLDDGNFNYDFVYIPDTTNLTRLVAYYSGVDTVSLMAIGHHTLNGTTPGKIVHLGFNVNTGNPILSDLIYPAISNTQKEIMHDICISDDLVVTLSHGYPKNQYIVRYFNQSFLPSNMRKYIYTFPNIQFNVSSDVYEFPLHLADISELKKAVCVSATDGNRNFTMVNILKRASHYVLSTQLVSHYDKSNKPLEMEYSAKYNDLLLLNDSYHSGMGMIQTMTHLNPDSVSDYISATEFFVKPNVLNHFSIIQKNKYAVAGVVPKTSPIQMIATKRIPPENTDCVDLTSFLVDFITVPDGVVVSTDAFILCTLGWNSSTATNSGDVIHIYCSE